MTRLARITQKIFGSAPGINQVTEFGSTVNGGSVYTVDPVVIQSSAAWIAGWYNAIAGGSFPVISDQNAVDFVETRQLAYLFQFGTGEWDSGTSYDIGSKANDGTGGIYTSITANNLNNALTDSTNWLPPGASKTAALATNLTIPSGYNYNTSFLIINTGVTMTVAGTGVFSAPSVVNGTLIITGTVHTN